MFKYFLIICFIVEVFLIGYKIGAIQCDNKNPVNSADANEENRNVKTNNHANRNTVRYR